MSIIIRQRSNTNALSDGGSYTKIERWKEGSKLIAATADDHSNTPEPPSSYAPEYPYNKSYVSLSGHFEEMDDTPGAERISRGHRSGTYEEIESDGSRIIKIVGDDFYVALKDHSLIVGGNLKITVQGNADLLVAGDMRTKVAGDRTTIVHGNDITYVRGKSLLYAFGDSYVQSGGNLRLRATANLEAVTDAMMTLQSQKAFEVNSYDILTLQSQKQLTINSVNDELALQAEGNLTLLTASGEMDLKASTVQIGADTLNLVSTTGSFYASGTLSLHGGIIDVNKAMLAVSWSTDTAISTPPDVPSQSTIPQLSGAPYNDLGQGNQLAGLEVSDSVMDPSCLAQLVYANDTSGIGALDDFTTFPKDRKPLDSTDYEPKDWALGV